MSNAIWGSINLIVGAPGVIATYKKSRYTGLSYGKTVLQQHGQEKLYLINGALDFAYITAGVSMWGFSDRINSIKTRQGSRVPANLHLHRDVFYWLLTGPCIFCIHSMPIMISTAILPDLHSQAQDSVTV
jgi:hypothetical protein